MDPPRRRIYLCSKANLGYFIWCWDSMFNERYKILRIVKAKLWRTGNALLGVELVVI